jgi:glycosyltransferase involved in cell wall biosynthesis
MPRRKFQSKAFLGDAEQEPKVLICIPAYNEAASIAEILDSMKETVPANFDILVVDDGSDDFTSDICRTKKVKVISHVFNMGYGAALKTAYKYATENRYDYVIQLDADGQHDVANIKPLYERLREEDYPAIVIGSRFLKGAVSFYVPGYKKLVISFFRWLIKLTGHIRITDPTSGLQGLKRDAFSHYARYRKFAIDYPDANMIVQMTMNGYFICEIPAIMHPRYAGESMHSGIIKPFMYIIKMMLSVFIVALRETNRTKKVHYKKPKL